MRTARAFLTLCAATAWATAFTTSCGTDEVTGQSGLLGGRAAVGGRGGVDGRGGAVAGRGGGGSSGRGGAASNGGSSAKSANLGRACIDNATCGTTSSLECFVDPAVPAGLCSRECADDSECAASAAGALCSGSLCVEGCTVGTVAVAKCHGRSDFACRSLGFVNTDTLCANDDACGEGALCSNGTCSRAVTGCLPTCASNSDCGTGFCNYGTGLCDMTPPPGLPMGSACDPAADACAGICLGTTGGAFTMCSGFCTFGLPGGVSCGWNGDGPADSACLFGPRFIAEIETGDAGYCGQLCDCDADCRNPNLSCISFTGESPDTGQSLVDLFQRAGYCTLAAPGRVSLPTCSGEGGAGGVGSAGAPGGPGTGGSPEAGAGG